MLSCPSGGGYFIGHDSVCATYCQLAAGADGIPGVVAAWKPQVDAWPRATRGAEADAGFFRIPGSRDTYVDAVSSYANPQTYAGCESTAGKVAERKANKKNAEHPVFDPETLVFSCVFRKRERNGAGQISEGPGQVMFA